MTDKTVHIDPKLHRRLRLVAAKTDRTLRDCLDEALAAWLAEREKGK